MPPRRTRNSDRPRASDRTMVATELNRLPSFKSRRTLSPLENEPKETEEQSREEPLEQSRDIPAGSGLDIETKNISATARGRCFFVDIPFYRTTYLKVRHSCRVRFSSAKYRIAWVQFLPATARSTASRSLSPRLVVGNAQQTPRQIPRNDY